MIVIKNKHAINKMRTAGNLLSGIFGEIEKTVVEGANTFEIDATIERLMKAAGLVPECKGYAGYRHATCISVNDILIHGVPSTRMVLKSGDFVTIDAVASYRGYCADMARCFFVGTPVEKAVEMAKVAQAALDEAIKLVRPGIHLSDISAKIQSVVEAAGCNVVRDFVGHGVGKDLHEEPEIPNYGVPGEGPILQVGMTLAIEPMIAEKSAETKILDDGWSVQIKDGGLAAHVEDTVCVTIDGVEVLTRNEQAYG